MIKGRYETSGSKAFQRDDFPKGLEIRNGSGNLPLPVLFGSKLARDGIWLCHLPAMWPWLSYLAFLGPTPLIYEYNNIPISLSF